MKYVALLRGVNVGGNNKVPMLELKICFELLGFTDVKTYINSGNVIFESKETECTKIESKCKQAISRQFSLNIDCVVMSAIELHTTFSKAPKWFNKDKAEKNNVLFVLSPYDAKTLIAEIGEGKPEYEKVEGVGRVIFWTAPLKTFSRTRYSQIVGTKVYKFITIRNANTAYKLSELTS